MAINIPPRPLVLCILDGWGLRPNTPDNAITQAHTPVWTALTQQWPFTRLAAAGEAVGLPPGQMGNSEVGHMTIGAGRVLFQDLPKVDHAIEDGSLFGHPKVRAMISFLQKNEKACHMMALLSDGGVHAHIRHFSAVLEFFAEQGVAVWIHGFLDGRDTPPQSALLYLKQIESLIQKYPDCLHWGTISGRYFAMDRDQRWDRTQKAYTEIVNPTFFHTCPIEAVDQFYGQGITDEFISPFALQGYHGIAQNDGLFVLNFRVDRTRQILSALLDPHCPLGGSHPVSFSHALSLTEVSLQHTAWITPLFFSQIPHQVLAEIISYQGLKQLHIGETEKYAHITFFFNGGREAPFPLEDRILIPSPAVATYDCSPEMSAQEITTQVLHTLAKKEYDFIVINYANPDMVGHTGNQAATQKAIETIDSCLGALSQQILKEKGCLIITADHGNAEMMIDPQTGIRHTAHTCHDVPFLTVGQTQPLRQKGELADIAPTICVLMGLPTPCAMSGKSLLKGA